MTTYRYPEITLTDAELESILTDTVLVLTDAEHPCPICDAEMHGVSRSIYVCAEHQETYIVTICPDCERPRFAAERNAGRCPSCQRRAAETVVFIEQGFVLPVMEVVGGD